MWCPQPISPLARARGCRWLLAGTTCCTKWFTRLHPKYKTPINSILFIACVTLAASVGVLVGVNEEEAFSLVQIWAFTLYGLAYLVMFAIPLAGNRKLPIQPRIWLRVAAA